MDYILLQKFLVAICIGAIIGTVKEKEKARKKNFGGFRTFILVALSGAFSYFLTDLTGITWIFPLIFIAIAILTGLSYLFTASTGRLGIKTELAIFLTYILGYVAMTEYATLAIILSAVIVFIIESDKFVHKFIANTNLAEWMATLRFGAVALIIYPILPNQYIDPYNLINPSKIWFLVVIISGVSFIGYFLIKILGSKRGILLNGILGGLVSSTATTVSLSNQSKVLLKQESPLALSTTISSIIMFIRVLVIQFIIYPPLVLDSALYIFIMASVMVVAGLIVCKDVIKNYEKKEMLKLEITSESPFNFFPALKLALILTIIEIASKVTLEYLGSKGIYIVSLISGLIDVDPIVISVSGIFKESNLASIVVVIAILIAVTMNTGLKGLIAYMMGSKSYGKKIMIIFGVTFFVGLLLVSFLLIGFGKTIALDYN